MRLFLGGTSFLPSYGGPARSVSRLGIALAEAGVDVSVWAPDNSAANSPFLKPAKGLQLLSGNLKEALEKANPQIIHDNGLWLGHNHSLASHGRKHQIPRVVSLRGMLLPIAFKHKSLKKKIAWQLYQKGDLRSATALHVTSEEEAAELHTFNLGVPAVCIPVGIDIPEALPPRKTDKALRTAIFIGRLHPIKGLPLLIEAWSRVRPPNWRMQIIGPDEGGYRQEVERVIKAHGVSKEFSLLGGLEGRKKAEALAGAELFVMPSLSENFGVAIGEALAHGLPVLTTTGTPWSNLLKEKCGWYVPATVEGLEAGLKEATGISESELQKFGQNGRNFVTARFSWKSVASQTIDLYQNCLNQKTTR